MQADELRKDRKKEHIDYFLKSTFKSSTLFEDVFIEHNSLPELDLGEIDTKTRFLDKNIDYPIMINAMTGGTEFSREINKSLSKIAKEYKIPMAVGSQTIALRDEDSYDSFKIVRKTIGSEGVVIANLNGYATLEDVKFVMDLIEADGLQIHLNPAQELVMKEGDRNFRGILNNIEKIASNIEKPVIVKEVGFGISMEVAKRLYDIGIRYIDVSGKGGTNFIEIEDRRYNELDFTDIYSWGIPTALSLLKCRRIGEDLTLIASGGIRTSLDILKSLVLGASLVGISGMILRELIGGGYEGANKYMEGLTYKLKALMLLTGSKNVEELKKLPYSVKGELKDLLMH
ncbi:type 2 isopentenyl-diphosphate Delta-isomerase [Tepidimicrobium xylanilyticum]|uniref:Isopentenyl-diphosphate delta-isomerase n=1 Tax=Tepidimicrobium xylanilyticum TaxID=1123352 RepID=A0A1H2X9H1_9FIRM|nr:type 2 isopentenyl-diphosphate Delta-isomerase [Tepidimicrobium xylanilyticum]GMG97436.1 isopentenyl-diphosphate delta-isomerase [Tepidimicrobium xylanilyticum]SDW89406.1 isopentenyl-diphosphate delta-isomerase [Tepidimicrobium xylanilyticum]